MVAPLVLYDPEFALTALFCADAFGPIFQLIIFRQVRVVNLVNFFGQGGLTLSLLDLFAGLLYMVNHLTLKAVFDTAAWTEVIGLAFFLLKKQIVTILSRALVHIWVLVTDLLPLKLLASFNLISC